MSYSSLSILLAVAVLVLLSTVVLLVTWLYQRYQNRFLQEARIPHPPLKFFSGNAEVLSKEGFARAHEKWVRSCGKICRVYFGASSYILVTDGYVIKEMLSIQMKNFSHKPVSSPCDSNWPFTQAVRGCILTVDWILLQDKSQMQSASGCSTGPLLSEKNLEYVIHHVDLACAQVVEQATEAARLGEAMKISKNFKQFALQSTVSSIFGKEVNIFEGKKDELVTSAGALLSSVREDSTNSNLDLLATHIPFFQAFSKYRFRKSKCWKRLEKLSSSVKHMVKVRKFHHRVLEHGDLLDSIIETHFDEQLGEDELCDICVAFFLASYVIIQNTLTYTAYLLAANPEVQDKICRLIDKQYLKKEESSVYEVTQSIPYLDWIVQESLRLYPPTAWTVRHCTETVKINGFTFSKGCDLVIPIQTIHRSPDYWDEPEVFNPERFRTGKESISTSLIANVGSYHYERLAMDYSLLGIKMVLVSVLTFFRFTRTSTTLEPLEIADSTVFSNLQQPTRGIELKIETR